jgi:hypothetical protein
VPHCGGIHDSIALDVLQQAHQLALFLVVPRDVLYLELEIRAKDAGVEDLHIGPAQLPLDILDDVGGSRGGQGQDRWVPQLLQRRLQRQERRPEIVTPLGNAMGFVYDHEIDLRLAERRQKFGIGQPLGGREYEVTLLLLYLIDGALLLGDPETAVDLQRLETTPLQLVHLVLHQGDQRRHNDGGAGEVQGRELVTQRFPRAGRHDGEGVVALQHRTDHFILSGPQALVTEGLLQ